MRSPALKSLWIFAALLAAPLAPAAAQPSIDAPGTVVHRAADAHFPERVGGFRRSEIRQFDAAGEDIGATYNLVRPEGRLVLSVYLYPPQRSFPSSRDGRRAQCSREFDQVTAVITQQHKGAQRIEEGGATPVDGADPALSRHAVYRFVAPFNGTNQEVRSEVALYCHVGGRWLVKYRATSNLGFDAGPAIAAFIRNGPWPGRAPPPAPEDIAALPGSALLSASPLFP
jgi:hypothetical protein